ncbi:uncharacterized protein LOC124457003 [Xenia sp. Carnegie-2017]|uniref:uncharacterized protein LOC124457003 n=1 Tax=Xenia sp. Carnegie-2017 TaxID=2897299 RepID=UPI001F03331E|nr:uncharacterized protein LOC124457003 [Xenia sp. Carnegie-2017]
MCLSFVFKEGRLLDKDGNVFNFYISDDHSKCQRNYEELGEAITEYVYELLQMEMGLVLLKIEIDKPFFFGKSKKEDTKRFIFVSKDYEKKEKLLILVHGSGVVRAGQWARRLIINDCIDHGTMIPYIKQAIEEDYGVVITNHNQNEVLVDVEGKKVYKEIQRVSPEKHFTYVWKNIIQKTQASKIFFVAHDYGGHLVVNNFKDYEKDLLERVVAVAFTDSVHSLSYTKPKIKQWFLKNSRNWVSSSHEIDTSMQYQEDEDHITRVSAGTSKHEETSWKARESIFKYFQDRAALFENDDCERPSKKMARYDSSSLPKEFGYQFNEEGRLLDKDGNVFNFYISDDHSKCQRNYEDLGEAITEYVYELLQNYMGLVLHKIEIDKPFFFGKNKKEGTERFIFVSKDYEKKEKLLILVHGSGVVRAGQWARRLIINDCIDHGTMIPYIKQAIEEDYGVVITNHNQNEVLVDVEGKKVYKEIQRVSPEKHFIYVWKNIIQKTEASKIFFVAHSYGGHLVVNNFKDYKKDLLERVVAVAFTDSVHSLRHTKPKIKQWFLKNSRNWVSSSHEIDTPMQYQEDEDHITRVSAGTSKHEETSWKAMESIFKYFQERAALFENDGKSPKDGNNENNCLEHNNCRNVTTAADDKGRDKDTSATPDNPNTKTTDDQGGDKETNATPDNPNAKTTDDQGGDKETNATPDNPNVKTADDQGGDKETNASPDNPNAKTTDDQGGDKETNATPDNPNTKKADDQGGDKETNATPDNLNTKKTDDQGG